MPLECTDAKSQPLAGVVYDAERCAEPRDLVAQGLKPSSEMGSYVYAFLGKRHRLTYDIKGEAAISSERFEFLATHLPLAAKLATTLGKTEYRIAYLQGDTGRFTAQRADKLKGTAELLFFDAAKARRGYYGWGESKVGPWRVSGSAYVVVTTRALGVSQNGQNKPLGNGPKRIAYDIRVRTAPINAFYNALMRMGLFKSIVVGQIEATVKDLTNAAAALRTQGLDQLSKDRRFSEQDLNDLRLLLAMQ